MMVREEKVSVVHVSRDESPLFQALLERRGVPYLMECIDDDCKFLVYTDKSLVDTLLKDLRFVRTVKNAIDVINWASLEMIYKELNIPGVFD